MSSSLQTQQQNPLRALLVALFRNLPAFKGKTRSIRILNRTINLIFGGEKVISHLSSGAKLILDTRSRTEYIAHYLGSYDEQMIKDLLSLFQPGWTVLDVGANIGFYAVPFGLKLKQNGGTLFCFEPVPSNFQRLQENLALNDLQNMHAFRLALSDKPATLKISLREDFQGGGQTGNAAIVIDEADGRFQQVNVEAVKLDDFMVQKGIARIDFIKVDIEGHEDLFLAGANGTIERYRPLILSELNEEFYRRRKIELDPWLEQFCRSHRYTALRPDVHGEWKKVESLADRRNTDDVLLCPSEAATNIQARLNSLA